IPEHRSVHRIPCMSRSAAATATVASLVILGVVVSTTGCNAAGQGKGQSQPPPVPVTVMEVRTRDVPIFADFAAQTYARNTVDVRSRVGGYIEKWLFHPGSEVKAGQVLYVLDVRPFEASL